MKKIIFFAHSVGGIIPILLAKNYLKKELFKKFINYEGNLTSYDTLTVTKKTSLYKKSEFKKKFKKLINICEGSDDLALKKWSQSLKKFLIMPFMTFPKMQFYFLNLINC